MIENDQHSEFIQSVEEEIKNERYRVLWHKYGKIAINTVSVFLILGAGYQYLEHRNEKSSLSSSSSFVQAQHLIEMEQYEQAFSVLKPISLKSTNVYENLSNLLMAGVHTKNGKTSEAIMLYKKIIEKNDAFFKPIAMLRLGYIYMNHHAPELKQITKDIESFSNKKHFMNHLALEFLGMDCLMSNNHLKASDIFVKLAQDKNTPQGIRLRARLISQGLASSTTPTSKSS
jgi:hypothetical protein